MKKLMTFILLIFMLGCSSVDMSNRKISKYFTMKEATMSSTGKKYRIKNIPSKSEYKNIIMTAKRMDKIRKVLKTKITITSWYRNKKINKKIRASKTSAHQDGLAVDFRVGINPKYVRAKLKRANIKYDQLIYYRRQKRLHIGFRESGKNERGQYWVK
jgi:hypothetical protein